MDFTASVPTEFVRPDVRATSRESRGHGLKEAFQSNRLKIPSSRETPQELGRSVPLLVEDTQGWSRSHFVLRLRVDAGCCDC